MFHWFESHTINALEPINGVRNKRSEIHYHSQHPINLHFCGFALRDVLRLHYMCVWVMCAMCGLLSRYDIYVWVTRHTPPETDGFWCCDVAHTLRAPSRKQTTHIQNGQVCGAIRRCNRALTLTPQTNAHTRKADAGFVVVITRAVCDKKHNTYVGCD